MKLTSIANSPPHFGLGSLRPAPGIMKLTACCEPNGVSQCAGHVKHLLLEFAILIQLLMCGGVRLHVSDVAIKLGEASG
jgi:hypothetical protein